MRILVDLTSIVGGGGLEQCKSLLGPLLSLEGIEVLCVVRAATPMQEFVVRNGIKYVCVSGAILSRVFVYIYRMNNICRQYGIDIIYVPFGIGSRRGKSTIQFINVAYPIICYPDSPFWSYLPLGLRIKNWLKSFIRRISIALNADVVVVESSVMAERLANYTAFRRTKIIQLPPVVGQVASRLKADCIASASTSATSSKLRLLYVTGASQHKNIWRLGEILKAVRSSLNVDVEIAVTVSQTEYLKCCATAKVYDYIKECGDGIEFLGATHGERLLEEFRRADIIINISDLESISNNFIEAQACGKPMLIADRDFGLNSVRTNYVVCEPHDPNSFVQAIEAYLGGDVKAPELSGEIAISGLKKANKLKEIFNLYSRRRNKAGGL